MVNIHKSTHSNTHMYIHIQAFVHTHIHVYTQLHNTYKYTIIFEWLSEDIGHLKINVGMLEIDGSHYDVFST